MMLFLQSYRLKWMLAFCISLAYTATWAQPGNPTYSLSTNTFFEIDMRPIALIDLETSAASTNFSLTVPAPTEAGDGIGSGALSSHTSNWINYSSAVRYVTSRDVQVNISYGTLPSDFEIRLDVGMASGTGGGTLGTPVAGTKILSSTPQNIITGIKGAFTGDGPTNGHQLSYSLFYTGSNFSTLETSATTITILYTLIDN